jgi:hypothetical protein
MSSQQNPSARDHEKPRTYCDLRKSTPNHYPKLATGSSYSLENSTFPASGYETELTDVDLDDGTFRQNLKFWIRISFEDNGMELTPNCVYNGF